MCEVKDRLIAVTGASGNLGQATAALLLEHGASVLLLDRHTESHATHFREALDAGRAWSAAADLANEDDAKRALEDVLAKATASRPLTGLVCTVGGYRGGSPVESSPWSDWEAMWTMNVHTTVSTVRAALPTLLEHQGSIVLVASQAALAGHAGEAAYSAAKAAVLRFSESLAAEVKGRSVRVNAVLPGTLDTPQNRSWMSPEAAKLAVAPRAVADVIAFLLSDAARAVTGAAIKVTGQQ